MYCVAHGICRSTWNKTKSRALQPAGQTLCSFSCNILKTQNLLDVLNGEFIINFPDTVDNAKANEGWAKLQQIVEDYKKDHNGASVYAPSFIEDCEPAVKKLQEEYDEFTVLRNTSFHK